MHNVRYFGSAGAIFFIVDMPNVLGRIKIDHMEQKNVFCLFFLGIYLRMITFAPLSQEVDGDGD